MNLYATEYRFRPRWNRGSKRGARDDSSSVEDSAAAVATLVRKYNDIIIFSRPFNLQKKTILFVFTVIVFLIFLYFFTYVFTEEAKALYP